MAEVEEFQDLQSGSEEVYSHACMVCKEEEIMRKAEGYCKNCQEYLCTNCIHHHRSVRVTKAHEIIEVTDDMEEIAGRFADTTIEEDVCLDHRKAPIDMYCKDHDDVGCQHCMTVKHSKCDKESIDASILKFNECALSSKLTVLDRILSGLSKAVDKSMKSDGKTIGEYKAYLEKQKAQKQMLLSKIDVVQMIDAAKQAGILHEYLANSKTKKKSIADTSKTVETLIHQSREIQESNNTKQKFITLNKLSKQIPLLENALDDASFIDKSFIAGSMVIEEMHLYKHTMGSGNGIVDLYNSLSRKGVKIPFQHIELDAPEAYDTVLNEGLATIIRTKHICLTAMKRFENTSLEELRHEWYTEFCNLNDCILKTKVKLTDGSLFGQGENRYKLLLVGDWGVGKSTFIRRNIAGNVSKNRLVSTCFRLLLIPQQATYLLKFGIPADKRGYLNSGMDFTKMCAVIMFDVSSPTSVSSVSKWYQRLQHQCGCIPIVVCGNKVDLASKTVKNSNIAKLNKLKQPFIKIQLISGRTMLNFEAPFIALARALTAKHSMEIRTKCSLYPALQPGLESKVLLQANEDARVNEDQDL